MRMLGWMSKVTRKNRIRNKYITGGFNSGQAIFLDVYGMSLGKKNQKQ